MVWADEHERVEQSEEQVRKAACAFQERTELRLLLFLKGTGVLVGSSGLHEIDWDVPRFEIGYWVRTSFAGQGYITEAVRAITGFAFECLGARRVAIRCDARNERSARVAERAGYRLEGTLRNEARAADGQLGDTRIYAMLPEEYPRPADGDDRR